MNNKATKIGIWTLFLLVLTLIFMSGASATVTSVTIQSPNQNYVYYTNSDVDVDASVIFSSPTSEVNCSLLFGYAFIDKDAYSLTSTSGINSFVFSPDFSSDASGSTWAATLYCENTSNSLLNASSTPGFFDIIYDSANPSISDNFTTGNEISLDRIYFNVSDGEFVDADSINVTFNGVADYTYDFASSELTCNASGLIVGCNILIPVIPVGDYQVSVEASDGAGNTRSKSFGTMTLTKQSRPSSHIVITSPLNHTAVNEGTVSFNFNIQNEPVSFTNDYNCTITTNTSDSYTEDKHFTSASGSFSYDTFGHEVVGWSLYCYNDVRTIQSPTYVVSFENATIGVQTSQTYFSLEDGLVNYFAFDYLKNSVNLTDVFSSSSFGSSVGLASHIGFGNALSFNGISGLVGSYDANDFTLNQNGFSVSLWFRPLSAKDSYLVSSSNSNFSISINSSGFLINFTNSSLTTNRLFVPQDMSSLWRNVILTSDGSDLLFYVDGNLVLKQTVGDIQSNVYGRNIEYLGQLSNNDVFNGSIDELLIYNRALSPFEINLLAGTQTPYDTSTHGDRSLFTVIPTNDYWNYLNCSLYVNNTYVDSADVQNGTRYTFVYDILSDDNFNWYFSCTDTFRNLSSSSKSVVVDYTPIAPLMLPLNTSTSNKSINIVGALGMAGDLTLTSLVQAYFGTATNTSSTIQNHSNYIGGGTVTNSVNAYAFRVNRSTLDPGVDAYLSVMKSGYVAVNADINTLFASANSFNPNLEFLEIVNVTPFQGTFVIELAQDMLVNLVAGNSVVFFTSPKPLGWFNASFDLLSGLNEMSVEGIVHNTVGPYSSFNIYYDDLLPNLIQGPWLSAIGKPWSLGFNVTDDYGLDDTSIYAIINNSLTSRTFNVSNSSEIQCNSNAFNASCTLYVPSSLTNGIYNITLFANDVAGNTGNSSGHEVYIRSSISAVTQINDTYSNASNGTILVNWNPVPDAYVAYYNLSVTNVPGAANVLDWVSVPNTSTNYTFDNETLKDYYGDFLFVDIYPVDIAGVTGPITSTDGLLLVDQTPPVMNNVSIIPDRSYWVRSNSQLHLYFNFTDDETGIAEYTYAIGTAPYPLPGWNSVLDETTTVQNDFVVTGLSLAQGGTYYVSARARNGYPFLWENSQSQYYSSSSVRVDSVEPSGGSISYTSGPLSTGSILVNYYVGTDATSGYLNASVMKKTSPLLNGQCGTFSTPYELVDWVSSPGPDSASVSIQNGFCYIFALYVYDKAGNLDIISGLTANNVSVDQTEPSTVDITIDDGSLTPDNEISVSWTVSSDLESGIDHYEYALGNSSNPVDWNEVVDWTNISYVNTSLIMSNLNLTHLETYYFKLRAWNHHGLFSTAVSNPITYVDLIVPQPLVVKQVGLDTTYPWVDNTSDGNTTILFTGEDNLASCVWSYYDIEYLNPGAGINYTHSCLSDGQGNYTCNISKPDGVSALEEGNYNVYVSCRDQAGNIQRANTNTDVSFAKDVGAPLVTVSGITNGALYNQIPVYINIQEATLDDAYYEVRTGAGLVGTGVLTTGNNSVTLPINPLVAEHWLTVYANDSFGQVNDTTNITFFVNSSIPSGYIYAPTEYLNKDTNLTFSMSFFNNYSYYIEGDGAITGVYSGYYSNASITTFDDFNLQINVSDFEDGDYTATLIVNNSVNGTLRTDTYYFDFVVDTEIPEYSDANDPGTVYDNETIDLYITSSEENVSVIFNGTTYYAVPVAFGDLVAPVGSGRYWVQIQPNKVDDFMDYMWVIYDLAGNNETISGSVFVNNRQTSFDDDITTILDFANADWSWNFDFSDKDITQRYNDFVCSIEHNGSFSLVNTPYSCVVDWDYASPGAYELNVTVDEYSNGTFVDSINKTVYINFSNTANTTLMLNTAYSVSGIIVDSVHLAASSSIEANTYTTMSRYGNNLTGLATVDYPNSPKIILSVDDIRLFISNISGGDIGNFAFKEKTLSTTTYASQDLGLSYRYVPLYSYAINISYPFQTNDLIDFDVSNYDLSDIILYRYDFNFVTNAVNYTSRTTVPLYSVSNNLALYNISGMEGLFVLVNDSYIPPPPEPVIPSSGGHSSSGGGFSMPPPPTTIVETTTNETDDSQTSQVVTPVASCFDNIQNQDETGVDCGGICASCVVEQSDNTDSNSESREEIPEFIPESNTKDKNKPARSFPWWALIALVVIAAGAGVGVISSKKQASDVIQKVIDAGDARDVVDIANFIQMHELQNNDIQDHELVSMGFSQNKIDLARYAMANEAMVNSVVQYLEQNTTKGYTSDELCNWLVSKDVHEGVVLLAKEKFQKPVTSMGSLDESSSMIDNSPLETNNLDKN
ncbi:LamG domain-containing protein [Candidatus Woesearchaeota archaeon]|nr:LamG domain-containing protein [Candidatus Woesearchaeota archaeon]